VLRGWKLKILPLITFAVLAGELIRDIPITENSFDVEFSKPYRVMTFNLNNYQLSKLSLDKKTDLICLQEVQLSDVNENLKNSSKKKWADYSWYFGSDFENIRSGLLVLSKQPITLVKRIECPSNQIDKGRYYYILKTKWNEKDIYIIPLHLESVDTQNGLTGLTKSWKIRLAQARIIASEIERIKEPLIVMGDFNTTPTDRIFKIICNQLTDTWIETGKSLGTTWHSHVPLFRIDYILYRNFQAAANGKVSFFRHSSDHMAYKVDLF
jgi:endonuclease/exonuclease/phosphatase family metal-dependent hydrolase